MWNLPGRISEHLTEQLRSRIPIGSEVDIVWSPAWQCRVSSVYTDPGHFSVTIIRLRGSTEIEVGDCHLQPAVKEEWFLCWFDQRPGAFRSRLESQRDESKGGDQNDRESLTDLSN